MQEVELFFVVCGTLLILPGCGRLVDWGSKTFNQGSDLVELTDVPQSYVRSVSIYDQVLTSAKFSALPLLDEILEAYACVYARRMGMDKEERQAFLRQWEQEHVSGLTFYVVSLYEYPLGKPESEWGVFAEVDTTVLRPLSIKKTELPPEFKVFFGKEFTIFRQAYLVTFAIDKEIASSSHIKLFFRSITKQALLCWNTPDDDLCSSCEDSLVPEICT